MIEIHFCEGCGYPNKPADDASVFTHVYPKERFECVKWMVCAGCGNPTDYTVPLTSLAPAVAALEQRQFSNAISGSE